MKSNCSEEHFSRLFQNEFQYLIVGKVVDQRLTTFGIQVDDQLILQSDDQKLKELLIRQRVVAERCQSFGQPKQEGGMKWFAVLSLDKFEKIVVQQGRRPTVTEQTVADDTFDVNLKLRLVAIRIQSRQPVVQQFGRVQFGRFVDSFVVHSQVEQCGHKLGTACGQVVCVELGTMKWLKLVKLDPTNQSTYLENI